MREYALPTESFLIPKREGKPYKVLLCEDKEINQLMGLNALESLGCLVDVAKDGEQAVILASQKKYDLIFMDCAMPKIDGYEATVRIRKFFADKGSEYYVPIVALTAKVLLHDREKCLDCGMDDYITKPARRDILCNAINKWCSPDSDIIFNKTEW
jgi:CheY-like chemotaxis protein